MVLVMAMPALAEAGKLSKIKRDVHQPKEETQENTSSDSQDESSDEQSSDSSSVSRHDIDIFFQTIRLLLSPFIAPYQSVEKSWWRTRPGFLAHPYQDGYWGYGAEFPALTSYSSALRISADVGKAQWGERVGGELRLTLGNRAEFTMNVQGFYEPVDGGGVEELYLFEPGVGYVFALGQLSQFRVGAEGVLFVDPVGAEALGVGLTYGVDFFPAQPISVSFDMGGGRLGGTGYFKAKGSVGLMLWAIEPHIGYEARWIGPNYIGTANAGVRLWF